MPEELFAQIEEGALEGYSKRRRETRKSQLASASALWADLLGGSVPLYYLQEALSPRTPALTRSIMGNYPGIIRISESMTLSDFPLLTGDVLDRMMLARWRDFPSAWRQFMRVNSNLRDFRTVRRIASDGLEGVWDSVPEQAEINYGSLSETGYTYAPQKYAKGAKISFEALMNDDLGAFEEIPDRLGRGGARTVSRFATTLYVDTNGPHASLYTGGNGNIITGDPALDISSLSDAYGQIRTATDADGQPIMIESVVLVVPPQLEVVARNILEAVDVRMTSAGGASGQELVVRNWVGSALTLVVDPYIPIVAATANGDTSWFLFASPSVGRPALEVGFLNGFAEPQLYQKMANTRRIGGDVDQTAGDFLTMSQEYKGVVAFGGTRLDPKSTIASNGSA